MRRQLLIFLIWTLVLVSTLPSISAEEPLPDIGIWDRCDALSSPERIWTICPENMTDVVLSIESTVQSPLGTGSIEIYHPGAAGVWELNVAEVFNEDATLRKDFTISRPRSVYVMSPRSIEWGIDIITRENVTDPMDWTIHTIAIQAVPANTMTEILLDYSAVPYSLLKMVAQVSVVPYVEEQEFTGYVAGITKGELGTLSIDTTPVLGEVFVNGISWGISPQSRRLDPGIYTVSFGDIAGYTKQSPQFVTVVANETEFFVGDYLKIYTITASSDSGGSITPSGSISVTQGNEQVFTVTPEEGYRLLEVVVDGNSVGKIDTYTFSSIQGSHTIHVSFELIPPGIPYNYLAFGIIALILGISFLRYLLTTRRKKNRHLS